MNKSKELISFFEGMLSRQEFLIPLVAATFQYPIHYYGMTSAALLEDLFVDASINYRNSYQRSVDITRPEGKASDGVADSKGVKGWDYQFQGEHFSHKVGKKIANIALLWDATVELPPDRKWNYESTMVYLLYRYRDSPGKLKFESGQQIMVRSLADYRNKDVTVSHSALIMERKEDGDWNLIEIVQCEANTNSASKAFQFEFMWGKMVDLWSKSAANKFDIFVTDSLLSEEIDVGQNATLDIGALPGIYVFEKELLQGIEVTRNNRGVLLPTSKVKELISLAASTGFFVFLPGWYMAYAENRPADLYLAQKIEFDLNNSAVRKR